MKQLESQKQEVKVAKESMLQVLQKRTFEKQDVLDRVEKLQQ